LYLQSNVNTRTYFARKKKADYAFEVVPKRPSFARRPKEKVYPEGTIPFQKIDVMGGCRQTQTHGSSSKDSTSLSTSDRLQHSQSLPGHQFLTEERVNKLSGQIQKRGQNDLEVTVFPSPQPSTCLGGGGQPQLVVPYSANLRSSSSSTPSNLNRQVSNTNSIPKKLNNLNCINKTTICTTVPSSRTRSLSSAAYAEAREQICRPLRGLKAFEEVEDDLFERDRNGEFR